jgi:DNA replication protein DnaC
VAALSKEVSVSEPNSVANIVPLAVKKMAEQKPLPPFAPYFERCERHGDWQVNFLDENGTERCRPGCPECRREQQAFSALRGARVPQRYQDRTLENYVADQPGQVTALNACRAYVRDFDEHASAGRCLLIVGTTGAGKTHLACAIGNALMSLRRTVLFCTVSELMDEFGATWRRDAQHAERDVVQAFAAADLLILDDVGVQNGSNAEQITLYRVIDARYRLGKPTLVSSNLDLDGTRKALGDRSFDRLREGGATVVLCNWPSYRIGSR